MQQQSDSPSGTKTFFLCVILAGRITEAKAELELGAPRGELFAGAGNQLDD
jgi:hypothetical protein